MTDTNIVTPKALVQTTNGKRFYGFSGSVTVTTAETKMLEIDNIGERDIFIAFEMGSKERDSTDVNCIINVNGATIMRHGLENQDQMYGFNEIKLILPANCSFEFLLQMTSGSAEWCVAAHGKYLSMD